MRNLIKFAFGVFVIGALALVGSALFQAPADRAHSPALVGDALLESAWAQIDSAIRQASVQLGPAFHSIPVRSQAFVRSNALEARMELETMASSLLMSEWLHGRMPYWIKWEVQGTTQAAGQKALAVVNGMPMVQAVKSNIHRLADAHPIPGAASDF
jgi:hypothetical protein